MDYGRRSDSWSTARPCSRRVEAVQKVFIGRLGSQVSYPGACLTRPSRVHPMFDSGRVQLADQPGCNCRNSVEVVNRTPVIRLAPGAAVGRPYLIVRRTRWAADPRKPVLVAMTPTATLANTADVQFASRIRRFAVRHPVGAFLLLAYPIAWTVLIGLTLVDVSIQLSLPATTLVGIAGPAVLITYWGGGRAVVRGLLSGVLRWRIGFGRLAFVAGAVPAMTLAVAAATGTLGNPNGGWGRLVLTYLVGLVVGAVGTNIWEELAWSGFVQTRLTARRGLFLGAALTAPLFAAEHLPIVVAAGGGPVKMLAVAGTLLAFSVIFRYLIGMVLVDTAGSILAVGLLHAASNASAANLSAVHGAWQPLVALVPLTLGMYAYRVIRDRRRGPAVPAWPA